MNVNKTMLKLEEITSLPVEEDEYEGTAQEYIIFNYADESSIEFGNDIPLINEADMTVKAVLNKSTNYFQIKDKIWEYLISCEAYDINFMTYLESITGNKKKRNLIFDFKLMKERN